MPRHRGHQENARLRRNQVFFEVQQGAEGCLMDRRLAHRDQPIADIDGVDAEGRPAVAQPRAGNQLAECCNSPLEPIARQSRQWVHQRRRGHIGNRPHRSCDIGIGLKVLIDHHVSPAIGEDRKDDGFHRSSRRIPLHSRYGIPARDGTATA